MGVHDRIGEKGPRTLRTLYITIPAGGKPRALLPRDRWAALRPDRYGEILMQVAIEIQQADALRDLKCMDNP